MKNVSIASLISVLLFTAATFPVSKFQTSYLVGANFGWPLAFFTSDPDKQIMAGRYFSFMNLSIDFSICALISFLMVHFLSLGKREKRRLA